MRNLALVFAVTLALCLVAGCGGGQPPPSAPAPAPETVAPPPAPTPEPTAEPTPTPSPVEPEAPALKTPDNLQAAYAGETDAMARYKAFAEAADKEKYKAVAMLFRAAVRAEEIHAKKIADVITAAGGTPVAGIATPEVKKTAENVKAALAGESAERDTVYPGFVETAKAEGRADAESLFKGMMEVEGEHAKLYKKADKDLAYWKKADREFWLCPVCGNVMTSRKESCGICGTDPGAFEEIK